MSEPLPLPGSHPGLVMAADFSAYSLAAAAIVVALLALLSTLRVWFPTSFGPDSYQASRFRATASGWLRPLATQTACWVSSVYSPGACPNVPRPMTAWPLLGRSEERRVGKEGTRARAAGRE